MAAMAQKGAGVMSIQRYRFDQNKCQYVPDENGRMCLYAVAADLEEENAALKKQLSVMPDVLTNLQIIAMWEPCVGPDEQGGLSILEAIDLAQEAINSIFAYRS